MELLFLFKKLATPLVLPPTGPLLLALVGWLLMKRWTRIGRMTIWSALIALFALSLPYTSSILMRKISLHSSVDSPEAREAQAIVVLGGGRRSAPEYPGYTTVSSYSLERVRYGALLAKQRQLPVLVSGGSVYSQAEPSEASLMADALAELGVSARWLEGRSRDTHENAVNSATILKREGIHTVLLVTHDFHERRSVAEFDLVGIRAIPAPTTLAPRISGSRSLPELLPNATALQLSSLALREMIGYLLLAPERDVTTEHPVSMASSAR